MTPRYLYSLTCLTKFPLTSSGATGRVGDLLREMATFSIVQGQIVGSNPLRDSINIMLYQEVVLRRLNNLVQSNVVCIHNHLSI